MAIIGKHTIIISPPLKDILVVDDQVSRLESMRAAGVFRDVEPVHARDAHEAIRLIYCRPWEVLFLDHDLETYVQDPYPREITGKHVVHAILAQSWRPELVVVHSLNTAAAQAMEAMLEDAMIQTIRTPVTAFTKWRPSRS